ncbi:helix-turn-helix domain-containing protein [uncultured Leifsonia sp.]|uniref:TetR/AcrR family transcriptional regulator n=1 Tax=uncultured Leifsonia sp. TaxID=340359 RepID=UPI0028D48935|nr:helix-turn-helix domain-containing protein [uncultured Leifsonia sp.]
MPQRGRPRNESSRAAILEAAGALLREQGYEAATISAIAERAGVGRQTLYRRWPSKAALFADAVLDGAASLDATADPPHGSIPAWIERFAGILATPDSAALVRALTAAAAADADESEKLYAQLTRPAHAQLVALLAAAGAGGPADAELLADATVGALLFRALTRAPIDAGYTTRLARLALAGPPDPAEG